MALVLVEPPAGCQQGQVTGKQGSLAIVAAVAPDETAHDLFRTLQNSRGSGLACLDQHLQAGRLGPGELVVIHGESGAGKSALLRNVLAAYIAGPDPADGGGHGVPVVLLDAEGDFDPYQIAEVVQGRARRLRKGLGQDRSGQPQPAAEEEVPAFVEEALSRLLVLRPREPADLLRKLAELRCILAVNPRVGLLAVDSMSAWQPVASCFPRSSTPLLQESWRALARLQREHYVAVVTTHRSSLGGGNSGSTGAWDTASVATRCRHLGIRRCPRNGLAHMPLQSDVFEVFPWSAAHGGLTSVAPFTLSQAGEIITMPCC